jgi:hypothetical protein
MIPLRALPPSLRGALIAISLSGVLFGVAMWRAYTPPAVDADTGDTTPSVVAPGSQSKLRGAQIGAAVERDPFNPARTRPAVRYRLAHEVAEVAGPAQRQPIRYVGSVVFPGDPSRNFLSVALGTNQNAAAQNIRVGEKIGDYTLKSFDSKTATFQSASGEMILIQAPR